MTRSLNLERSARPLIFNCVVMTLKPVLILFLGFEAYTKQKFLLLISLLFNFLQIIIHRIVYFELQLHGLKIPDGLFLERIFLV